MCYRYRMFLYICNVSNSMQMHLKHVFCDEIVSFGILLAGFSNVVYAE